MKITALQSSIRTIKPNDPRFIINDGLMLSPRAGFEINSQCPQEYRLIIQECIGRGWLIPVSHITERELIFMGLNTNNDH